MQSLPHTALGILSLPTPGSVFPQELPSEREDPCTACQLRGEPHPKSPGASAPDASPAREKHSLPATRQPSTVPLLPTLAGAVKLTVPTTPKPGTTEGDGARPAGMPTARQARCQSAARGLWRALVRRALCRHGGTLETPPASPQCPWRSIPEALREGERPQRAQQSAPPFQTACYYF